ncbi:hypothetical protein ACJRO7_005387 [Eucalyptus globulus]|uniref:Uncharacterized protein n=1 Tax=Eucalyptus globulus TaxID=34317 RepID=A0ABD3J5J2_EUCGL
MEGQGMETGQILSMNGGCGEESYAKNSHAQNAYLSKTIPVLHAALLDFCTKKLPATITIADLGCSSGPNTLFAISQSMSIIHDTCRQIGCSPPQFSVFLNDLPSNDFNTVFKSLPQFQKRMMEENGQDFGPCYIAGVPGSFYGRLFPAKSLHFVQSSTSLHWLSQVPLELSDCSDKAMVNKGKIYISRTSPPRVVEAYLSQFRRDFSSFLRLRSEEIAPGGHMVLTFRGRRMPDPFPDESCLLWDYLGLAFQDLVSQGLIEEEKLDSYNTPYYEPYVEDVRAEIEREGSFTLDRLEIIVAPWDGMNGGQRYDRRKTAEMMAKAMRAVNESMITSHFGDQILDSLFERFIDIMARDTKEVEHPNLVVSLIRKS